MSGEPDIQRIKAPPLMPAEQPDPMTQAEKEELQKKAATPTDRLVVAFHSHLACLNGHVDHHKGEGERFRGEVSALRDVLKAERLRAERLGMENVKLRELSWAVGWMTLLGNGMTAIGGALLGVAGCWPGLNDSAKFVFSGGGIAMAFCGIVLIVLSYRTGLRAREEAAN